MSISFYLSSLSSPQLLIMTCAHSFPGWNCVQQKEITGRYGLLLLLLLLQYTAQCRVEKKHLYCFYLPSPHLPSLPWPAIHTGQSAKYTKERKCANCLVSHIWIVKMKQSGQFSSWRITLSLIIVSASVLVCKCATASVLLLVHKQPLTSLRCQLTSRPDTVQQRSNHS